MSALPEELIQPLSRRHALSVNVALWVVVVGAIALFSSTLLSLVRVWIESADYEHGFLIALISLGLLFRDRGRFATAAVRPQLALLIALAAILLCWMISYRAHSEMLQQGAFPLAMLLAIGSAFGSQVARIALLPIGSFYFAIPIWDHLTPVLQAMSTATSETVLAWMGVPTQVEGFNVTIPEGRFVIIEGCSGKRFLIMALAVAVFAAATQEVKGRRFFALIALATVCALVTNWLRIIIIIYAGHVSNMQHYLVAVEHFSLGYALYVPLLAAIVFAARRWGSNLPTDVTPASPSVRSSVLLRGMAAPLALMIVAAGVLGITRERSNMRAALFQPPLLTSTWQGPLPPQPDWAPSYAGAQQEIRVSYLDGSRRLELYANVYGVQAQGGELIQYGNSVTPSASWTVVRTIPMAAPFEAQIATSQLNVRWVVARTYVVGGRLTASSGIAQLLYGWSALWHPAPSGILALAAACDSDCDAAAAAVSKFWNENEHALASMIPGKI